MATVGTFFDGTNDEIVLGSADFTMTTTFSVWGMVYINNMASARYVLAAMNGANPVVEVHFDGGNIAVGVAGDTPPWFSAATAPNWYFFCITKASGTVAPKLYLTTDGSTWSKDGAAADAGTLANVASGAIDDFRIGSVLASNYWNGEIAALGISNTELSSGTAKGLIDYSTWSGVSGLQFNTGKSMISGGTVDDTSSVNNNEASRVGATVGSQTVPSWFTNFALDPAPAGDWPTDISRAGTGTRSAGGTTTVTPALPTTVKGQAAIAFRAIKPESATATAETGWTQLFSATGGTGATGVDAGLTRIACDWKELAGGDSNPTFDQGTSPNSVNAVVETFTRDPACYWDIISGGTGDDSTHGTGRSVTSGTSVSWQPGDIVLCGVASDTDTTTAYTSPSITISGCTLGTTTEVLAAGGVGTGNDSGLMVYQATVVSGQATAAAAISLTGGPSSCGPAGFVRIRQTWPPVGPIIIRPQGGTATNATAETTSVTVTAFNASEKVATTGGLASVTVTGNQAAANIKPNAGAGSVTATANNATLDLKTTGGLASVGATAGGGAGSVAVGPTAGSVSVSAFDATVSTAVATSANAGAGSVTVTANNPALSIAPNAGGGSVTVTGNNAAPSLQTSAGAGSVSASAGGGAGSVKVGPGLGSVTATAFNATVTTGTQTNAQAGTASVTATAFDASCKVAATAERAVVTCTASNASAGVGPSAGSASVTCSSQNPGRSLACTAERALVTVGAFNPAVDNGAGVATYYPVVRARRPDVVRLSRPRIIRTRRPRLN